MECSERTRWCWEKVPINTEPLVKYVKELDPQNRPTTVVNIMMATPERDLISPLIDVLCLNRYYGWYVNHGDIEGAREGSS